MLGGVLLGIAGVVVGLVGWGLVESVRVRCGTRELPIAGLPRELDALRILHLSDFHLGAPSLAFVALRRAVRWARTQDVDLVAITGDLLSRQRGEPELRSALATLRARHGIVAVLGNHDVGVRRDPLSRPTEVGDLARDGVLLLRDASATIVARRASVQVAGIDPLTYVRRAADPAGLADPLADLRVLLCHFPRVVDRWRVSDYALVLAGHSHGGQINLPTPRGPFRLAHPRARYAEGVHRLAGGRTTLVVTRGIGTAFVPLRLFCRPEATVLVLRVAGLAARSDPA